MNTNTALLQSMKKVYKKFSITHKFMQLQQQLQQLQQMQQHHNQLLQRLEQRMQEMENKQTVQILKLRAALTQLHSRQQTDFLVSSRYQPATPKTYETYLTELEALDPETFPVWQQCFEVGRLAYLADPDSSCSTEHNLYATVFQSFVANHATGHLLDQGCGIHGLPYYLEGYPSALISAIEPLELVAPVDFEVVRGFAEFLPWPDDSFATIVNGTSLDHVLCLETALQETYRVLQPEGKFLVWIASMHGAKPFDKTKRPIQAIDQFHLFHFHEQWFEALMAKQFKIVDKLTFPTASFDHIFYAFKKRV